IVEATTLGNEIRVLRDGEEVLKVLDDELKGTFVGVFGVKAVGKPVVFDDFLARRYGGEYEAAAFAPSQVAFRGAGTHYYPLYFEHMSLERYGHHLSNPVEPILAHGKFVADLLLLPYSIGRTPPWECQSNAGYYRPGDVVLPMRIMLPEWDTEGGLLQITAVALSFALLP
ncbi:MAG: hypothetical protein ACRC1K_22365, partial [Planctomycetia bacterium]